MIYSFKRFFSLYLQYFFIFLFSFGILSSNLVLAQDPSLVAHWPLDEAIGINAADISGNFNDGTLFGEPAWAIGIIGGSALSFAGIEDVVFIPDPGLGWNLDITNSITISVWINPSSFTFSGQEKIVSKDNAYEFQVDANSVGSYQLRLNNAPSSIARRGDSTLTQGIWQHIAVTWDGSTVQYYLGGFPDGGYSFAVPLNTNDAGLGLGARPVSGGTTSGEFNGNIDDVRIYNRALNASEVQALFALGAGNDTAAPARFGANPSGFLAAGTTDINISLTTDENAICRFDTNQNTFYTDMPNTFETTGGTSHINFIPGLAGGTTHRFYVRCQDGVGNTNSEDFLISFSIRGAGGTGFHPTDLNPLMFYIESTFFNDFNNRQRSIATCNTLECFNAPDLTTIENQYCDTVVDQNAIAGARGTAPNGCIRRWEDQSPYISNRADGTELIVGRDFGQDDHEKPLFIPNCINGHPCSRGLVKKDPPFTQNTTFEIEVSDAFANQGNPPTGNPPDVGLNDDFSIFHLVRPIEQGENWWYFGCSGLRGLRHNVIDNSLFYFCGGAGGVACENQGLLTIPEAIELNQWQLIEIHRDTDDNLQVVVNGEDVSLPNNLNAGGGWCYHNVTSREKGEADGIMEGDLAASAVYNRNLTEQERQDMRNYLDNIYDFLNDRPIIQPKDHKTPRGYQARACGFDMDDDFIYGEPADDCNVGDGVTTDPDGDGVDEDLLYVDCQNGSDTMGDGTPGTPYRTIDYALSHTNGPGNGAEDIIAFTGICSPNNITISQSGIPGIKIRPKSGSEERDFEYPSNPIMIIGWDKDNDGQYPPFDTDDVSELYGGSPSCWAQAFNTSRVVAVSNLEIAHFTVREYGTCEPSDTASGFMAHIGPLDQVYSHHYFHDLSIVDVNRAEINGESGTIIHSLFSAGSYKWAAWENQEILNASGYSYRGSSGSLLAGDSGPWRFQGTTRTCFANGIGQNSTGTLCTGWKNWRYISQVEILDQIFDMNIDAGWVVDANVANEFVGPVQCVQDWVIRNNKVIDVKTPFVVVGFDEDACTPESDGFPSRPTKDILIEGNIWTNSFRWANSPTQNAGGTCLAIAGCDSLEATVSNVKFYNNVCWSGVDMGPIINVNCLQDFDDNPGSYEFINNTLYAGGAITFGALNISNADFGTFTENDITFQNNIVVIRPNDTAIRIPFPLDSFISDNNTFSPNARFFWEGVNLGLGTTNWYNASGQDFSSFECIPTFVDAANGDLHLDPSDGCALNFGMDLSRDIVTDIDWEGRPADNFWDIGADELSGPPVPDTTPPNRSNGAPSGSLPSGTTDTDISLNTNEASTCKYSMTPGISFDSMTSTLNMTGGLAHSTPLTGLMDEQTFTFYVKCEDALGNDNTDDFQISFDIRSEVIDLVPPVRSNGAPTGTLASGTTQANISLITDEDATCKYSTTPGVTFDSMISTFTTTGGTNHSSNITGLSDGQTYNYYVKCEDGLGNNNTDDFIISFSVNMLVDNLPPFRSNGSPSGILSAGTMQTNILLNTNENATCRYSITSGVDFSSMTSTFNTTGGTSHSSNIAGLLDGQLYSYFVKCQDEFNNSNTSDFLIAFGIGEVVLPDPIMLEALLPSQAGVENVLMSINATPNGQVQFIYGFNQQAVLADGICSGLQVGILNPRTTLPQVTADFSGKAILNVQIPSNAGGATVLVQAVDLSSCTVSNLNIESLSSSSMSTLHSMVPGQAGTLNSLSASHFSPNSDVKFIWGFTKQTVTANNICPGFSSGIFNPRTLTQVRSNDSGHVTIDFYVPSDLAGVDVFIQAVDISTCMGSNVNAETL